MTARYLILFAISALAFASSVSAHSDMDKPLFVATNGVDAGNCQDANTPCRTIGYALARVGKGGQLRVATGQYEMADVADLFHVVSGIVDIRGGFGRADNFQQPGASATTLTGVPAQYRAQLSSRGFHVVADRKGIDTTVVVETEQMLTQHKRMQTAMKIAPCVGGQVNGLTCENTEFLAHVPFSAVSAFPGAAADVWGFVDLNTNREYAIVGYNSGTAVFDVTDAENPREVGFVDGQNTVWRDIKVHQSFNASENRWNAYAYITADGSSDGLFVLDLTDLPQRISRRSYVSDFASAHNVYAINTDFSTGLSLTSADSGLIIAGSSNGGGVFRVYSLANPQSPTFSVIPAVSNSDYMHDAASMIIRDSRKDTQCVNAVDYCEVLFDFNESTIDIWDITVASTPVRLSRTAYANSRYTHSGWPSEDGQHLFVHDELDEQGLGLQTTVRTFSLSNLTAPSLVGTWSGPTTAIDHNGFVRGNRYYMSNYSRGLTILDITNPVAPQPIGRLDTYPFSDSASFVGAWGAYPYFHSGNIAVSDISSGLYMVGDETLVNAAGSLSLAASSFAGAEGSAIPIAVQRSGGSIGAASVDYVLIPATADDTDVVSQSGVLTWADGDTSDKVVTLNSQADGVAEGLERMLVKLIAPTGGATLGPQSVASIYINDVGDGASIEFDRSQISVPERGFSTAVIAVQRRGNAIAAANVDFALSDGDATAVSDYLGATSGTLNWAAGDADPKWIELDIIDDAAAEADEFLELTLSAPSGASVGAAATLRIDILDGSGSNQAPNSVAGASQTVESGVVVTLDGGGSNDPNGDALSFQWSQTLGPTVALSDASAASTSFTAPDVASDTLLRFVLDVTDPSGLNDSSTASITVRAPGSGSNGLGGGGGSFGGLLTILVGGLAVRRRFIRTDVA